MKIVQLLPAMNLGGVERGVVELSRRLVGAGMESIVIAKSGALSPTITADGGTHVDFDCGNKNILTAPRRIVRFRRLLRQLQPDIIHVRSRAPAWLLRFSRAAVPNAAVVSTFHGIYSVSRYSAEMANADAIICPSRAVVDYVRDTYRAPTDKLHLIERGADFDYFNPALVDNDFCDTFRREQQLHGQRVIAIVGRASALKGHALFLRAFAAAQHTTPAVALLVGVNADDKRGKALQELANHLDIADRIRFAGVQKEMREIYHIADILVSASIKPESFGRTMAEAIAMNRPVIAAAHGGALDIVQHEKNGLLFTSANADALTAALQQAETITWHNLRESVLHLSLTNMTAKTVEVYRQVVD